MNSNVEYLDSITITLDELESLETCEFCGCYLEPDEHVICWECTTKAERDMNE